MTGYLPGGGMAAGELRIADWLGETKPAATGAKAATPPVAAHAYLVATVNAVPLRTIMELTEVKGYGDLGFDTAGKGAVEVGGGGPGSDISRAVIVDGGPQVPPARG